MPETPPPPVQPAPGEIPAEAAIRADERARIAAWLSERVASKFNLGCWLYGRHGMTVGAGPDAVLKAVIADLESTGDWEPGDA